MHFTFAQYQESADFLRSKLGDFQPKVAMVLGSGLGYLGDVVENPIVVPYGEIPHFKASTAPGHKGQLVLTEVSAISPNRFQLYHKSPLKSMDLLTSK